MAPAKKKGSSKPKPKAKAKPAAKPKKAQAKAKAKPKAKPKATPKSKAKKPAAKKPKPQVEQVFAPAPAPAEPIAEGFEFSDDDLDGLSFMAESDAKPDASAFAPGILVEHDDGKFSVVYSKFPSTPDLEAVYDARGLQGGGYTWHGFVVHLMKQHAPQALDAVEFDPEGSMFCAVSKDLTALQAVSAALAQLENIELVKQLAATVDVSEYD